MEGLAIYVLISFFSWAVGFSMALALVVQMIDKTLKEQTAAVKVKTSVKDLNPNKYE